MKKEIGVLGGAGFLGREIVRVLEKKHNVSAITKYNYDFYKYKHFDIIINANGNSKKHLAEKDPVWDFAASVLSVYKTLFDFEFKRYIYISSIDSHSENIYGFHKGLAEQIIVEHAYNKNFEYSIIRCASIIGKDMTKGVVYDILRDIPLRITADSRMYFITNTAIAQLIDKGLISTDDGDYCFSHNIEARGAANITVAEVAKVLGKRVKYSKEAVEQSYDLENSQFKCSFFKFKTSEQYLKCL